MEPTRFTVRRQKTSAGDYSVTVSDAAGNITVHCPAHRPQPDALTATPLRHCPCQYGQNGQAYTELLPRAVLRLPICVGHRCLKRKCKRIAEPTSPSPTPGCAATATVQISENILPRPLPYSKPLRSTASVKTGTALQVQPSEAKRPSSSSGARKASLGPPASIAAGNYTVTVTDAAEFRLCPGCHTSPTPLKLPQSHRTRQHRKCRRQVTASATGGNPDFSFRWDNGETAAQAAQLAPGTHTVTITDAARHRHRPNLREYPALTIAIQQTAEINCFGENGTYALQVQPSGGKVLFQFQGARNTTGRPPTFAAGNYTVTVTDAAGIPAPPRLPYQPDALKASATATAPASTGNADGQATASATGGNPDFSFRWDNGETAAQAAQLAPGTHTVTITDAKGAATATVEISENILPCPLPYSRPLRSTVSVKIYRPPGAALRRQNFPVPVEPGFTFTGHTRRFAAGNYTVTVTDAAGNSASAQAAIPQPDALKASATTTAPASTGNADGQATASATGGNPDFSFRWDNGETAAQAAQLAREPTPSPSPTPGCAATATVEISENILPLTIAIQQTAEINCFGEKQHALQVQPSGGKILPVPGSQDTYRAKFPPPRCRQLYRHRHRCCRNSRLRPGCHTSPTPLKPATATAPASTGNADGQATASATGGNPDFSFRWDNGETAAQAAQLAREPTPSPSPTPRVRRHRHRRNFREYPALVPLPYSRPLRSTAFGENHTAPRCSPPRQGVPSSSSGEPGMAFVA